MNDVTMAMMTSSPPAAASAAATPPTLTEATFTVGPAGSMRTVRAG